MSAEIYLSKYLKYKSKYLKERRKILQSAGACTNNVVMYYDLDNDIKQCVDAKITPGVTVKISFMPRKYDAIGESHFLSVADEQYMTNYINSPSWQKFLSYCFDDLKIYCSSDDLTMTNIATEIKIINNKLTIIINGAIAEMNDTSEIKLGLCDLYDAMHKGFYKLIRSNAAIDEIGRLDVDRGTRMQIEF